MTREPIATDTFYPGNTTILKKQLRSFLCNPKTKQKAYGCLMPHAGYAYSGKIATQTAERIQLPKNIILIGPNHKGFGNAFGLFAKGNWRTPLGDVAVNTLLNTALLEECALIKDDTGAHAYEHSLEVQLPILQFLSAQPFCITPLVVGAAQPQDYEHIGSAIAKTINKLSLNNETLIIASSDMTHYEPHTRAQEKDKQAIEAMLTLDENLLLKRISQYNISMCGYAAAAISLIAIKKLGAKNAELVGYQTSAETSGDYDAVVGYAGMIFS